MADFEIAVEPRAELGKSAMRRMRRTGQVPAIVYGADKDPMAVSLSRNALRKQMEGEGFFSHILNVKIAGHGDEQAVVKALQRHPATTEVLHLDLLRVSATQKLTLTVPLHFERESESPGVRMGGVVSHHVTEVEISCLPGDLPEYIAVDASGLELGESIHLSDIAVPSGVELTALAHDNDLAVVSAALMRASEEELEAAEEEAEAAAPPPEEGAGEGPQED